MGFTVIVNVIFPPEHPFATGVTVIVAVTADVPVLTPVKDDIFPLPLDAKPIDDALFVQLYTVPVIPPPNVMVDVAAPLHTV